MYMAYLSFELGAANFGVTKILQQFNLPSMETFTLLE